ncbi:hypothetical protein CEXT_453901 [Caerostris extrusa]|uniref:Secreted protein n=1 Tax=Caerostris extrusa TaxID=172846 RepID=A0AAV4MCQ7_CAEEX|nr:hypothetical protein CEXT_453901 [Caerostris extrusa]
MKERKKKRARSSISASYLCMFVVTNRLQTMKLETDRAAAHRKLTMETRESSKSQAEKAGGGWWKKKKKILSVLSRRKVV